MVEPYFCHSLLLKWTGGIFISIFTLNRILGCCNWRNTINPLNVIGAKESGRTQIVIVLILFAILGTFSVMGVFHIDAAKYDPFMPFGFDSISATTALVFVSFLGFVKIVAVAEEIKNPSKNLPRALPELKENWKELGFGMDSCYSCFECE